LRQMEKYSEIADGTMSKGLALGSLREFAAAVSRVRGVKFHISHFTVNSL